MNKEIINYGIGKNYLESWNYTEALREIFQNFIDFGKYQTYVLERKEKVTVLLENKYNPESLEFLQLGKSIKYQENSIGKHGEGLKMALLVFLRNNEFIQIFYNNTRIKPIWNNQIIGETLALELSTTKVNYSNFNIEFNCPKEIYNSFVKNIITEKDIIFSNNYHGAIVNKEQGNIYSGGLFVTNLKNIKKAYDLSPKVLSLDRDRRIPNSFEVSYHTSKINEALLEKEKEKERINFIDQNYDDSIYISYVPPKQIEEIKVKEILGKPQFVTKVLNTETNLEEEIIINNESIKKYLNTQNVFQKAINKIKSFIASKLGIKDLLLNFRNKYCISKDMKEDFDIIIEKLGINLEE